MNVLFGNMQKALAVLSRYWLLFLTIGVSGTPAVSMALPCSYSFNVTMLNPEVPINPAAQIGQVVGRASGSWGNVPPGGCTGVGMGQIIGIGTPNGTVYPTTIPGVGYTGQITGNYIRPLTDMWPTGFTRDLPGWFTDGFPAGTLDIIFIKTGTISPNGGTFGSGPIGYMMVNNQIGATYNLINTLTVLPVSNACTVTQSAITVNMDSAMSADFKNAGDASKDTAFTIPVKCTSSANIALSFSGDMVNSSLGVFKNTNSDTSSTIGVQLLDKNNNPVSTGSGQYIQVGNVNGVKNYQMTARYYALANNVSAGDVSAIVYATIVYN